MGRCGVFLLSTLLVVGCRHTTEPPSGPVDLKIGFAGANVQGSQFGVGQFATVLSLEGLTYNEVDGRPTPRLANNFEWENGGLTLRLSLRAGVRFHDGTPLTAQVTADLLRGTTQNVNNRHQYPSLANVTRIRTDNNLEVLLDLSERSAFLPEELSDVLEHGGRYVGTGPFRLVKRDQSELVFERFDSYYRGIPSVSRVTILPFESLRTAWSSLLRGDVDIVSDVPPDAVEFIESQDIEVISFARGFQYLVAFNSARPQFRLPRVRQALNMAVDRDSLIQRVLRGYGTPATGPLWPHHWAYDSTLQPFRFDPVTAMSLLDEAGFAASRLPATDTAPPARLRFTCILPAGYPVLERIGLLIQKQLYDVGVDMRFEVLDVQEFSDRISSGSFDAVLNEQISGPTLGRPYIFWRSRRNAKGQYNTFGYENVEAERLFHTLSTSLNEAAVRSTTNQLQRILLEDPPAIFLAWSERLRAIRKQDFDIVRQPGRDPLLTLWQWQPTGSPATSLTE